jgi:teichoic acid transport system permease protein
MATTSSARVVSVYEPTVTGLPPSLRAYVGEVWERRMFIWHMARTKMKAQHYDTVMGVVWLVIDPLVVAATYLLIRVVFNAGGTGAHRAHLIANLIMGVSFFFLVRDIVQGCSASIVQNRSMVLNSSAPRACFPAVVLVRAICDLGPALGVYLAFHLVLQQPIGFSLLFLPIIIGLLILFSLGAGLFFAPLTVFFRDTGTLLPYLIRIWMYVTPVMYTIAEIPPSLHWVLVLNPLYPFFAMLQQVFYAQWPSPGYMIAALCWTILTCVAGSIAFLIRERDYAVRL